MPYSMDLRRRVVAALERGETIQSTALRLEISERTVSEWRRRHAAGRLEPERSGPRGPTKLTEADHRKLATTVAQQPGITLRELASMMSVSVAESTVCRALQKLKPTLKKVIDRLGAGSNRRVVCTTELRACPAFRRDRSIRVSR